MIECTLLGGGQVYLLDYKTVAPSYCSGDYGRLVLAFFAGYRYLSQYNKQDNGFIS